MAVDYSKSFPIIEYYTRVVEPLNKSRFRTTGGNKMICPFHRDTDPSLGIVKSKQGEKYHCFGCGAWGDVVDMHIQIEKQYKKRYINREEAIKDLSRIFGVEVDYKEDSKSLNDNPNIDSKRYDLMRSNRNNFDISDFKYKFLEAKLNHKGIGYFNALMMSMLYELKNQEQ